MHPDISQVDDKVYDRVWKIIEQIGAEERHFNDLQAKYRNMASVWLLATFAAIGFLMSETIHLYIDRVLLIAVVAAAGCFGIMLLWVVDLLVYHRLLDACFIEGLILEEQYTWLPPFRSNMMRTQQGQGVLFRVVVFYLGPIVLLIFVSGGAFSLWAAKYHWLLAVACAITAVISACGAAYLVLSKTENTDAIRERLSQARTSVKSERAS